MYIFLVFILPILLGIGYAHNQNRSVFKSLIVTGLFGWIGLFGMFIFLKQRDPKTGFLK